MFRKPPYYLTAYGLAVREGFKGTLEQWLESLRGEKGDGVELRYQDDKLQWRSVPPEGAQIPEDWEEDEWKDLLELEDIRGPVVEQTLVQAQQAAQEATEAARDAEMSKLFAEGAVQDALTHSNNAKQAETDAQLQANAAKAQAEAAAAAASSAGQSCTGAAAHAELAQRARQVAEAAEENARHAEEDAYNSAEEAKRAMEEAGRVAAHAEDSEQRAAEYARDAGEAENNAQRAAGEAEMMASHAQGHEQMAAQYAQEALEAARFVAVTTEYAVSEDGSTPPKVWETDIPELTAEKPFLWMKVNKNYMDGTAAADVGVIGRYSADGKDGSSTTIKLLYGVSSEPAENTVTGWQGTIPRMSEAYPYLWIEISTETQTSKGGSIVIEKGIIGYYSTPDSGGNANLTPELRTALINYYTHVMPNFDDANGLAYINAILTALGAETREESEEPDEPVIPDEPDEPETPVVTLSSISATYSGGDVAVGTAVSDLTGIVVTAHYSDGTSKAVTGYTLSGNITEGSNTITVSYGGKTATFTVTGVAESGGEPEDTAVALGTSWQHSQANKAGYYTDGGETAYTPEWTNAKCILSQDVFEKDTLLRITVTPTGQTYCAYLFTSSLIEEGRILSTPDTDDLFYWCVADSNGWNKNVYTVEYTVHAGYKLCILGNPSSNVDIITVEKVVA